MRNDVVKFAKEMSRGELDHEIDFIQDIQFKSQLDVLQIMGIDNDKLMDVIDIITTMADNIMLHITDLYLNDWIK